MRSYLQHYIDGAWVDSIGGTRHLVINPATEEPCTEITLGTAADVDAAVVAARRAFKSFSETTREERTALIERIITEYRKRIPDIAESISEEMGVPISLSLAAQAPLGMNEFRAVLPVLKRFNFTEEQDEAIVVYEPIGVVAVITPWNWPIDQIGKKVAPALAAGNTIILKGSEECPGNAAILAEVMDAAGVPAGVFNVIQGDGAGVGQALAAHPDIDMISFTGSTRAGIQVAKAAADNVKRVVQELGGKGPNFVLEGCDLKEVLPSTVAGLLINTGQSCIAQARILVHESQLDEAIDVISSLFSQTSIGDPSAEGNHIGPVVNRAQFDKIQDLIQSGIDEGATLVTGGVGRPAGFDTGYFVQPTVFSNVTPDMRIAREEIFGPVAVIMSYDSLDEGIELANDTTYGLCAAISGDKETALRVAPKLRSGMVTINKWLPAGIGFTEDWEPGVDGAPFGGYKRSGNGRENGLHGFKEFLEVKAITL